jgi:succinate-semialdehyde dehydrogenase/glutarate-semialdehyde dehydrogenase
MSATFEIRNPATGELIATVPEMTADDARRAIEDARTAQPAWAARTGKDRSKILRAWFDLLSARAEDIAQAICRESGKPIVEARGEAAYGASFVEWFAEEAKRVYGDTIPATHPDRRIIVLKQPAGVAAAITPWNFPLAMITRKVAPALAAGCTIVVKPAAETPLTALLAAELAYEAGVPRDALALVTGTDAPAIGQVFTTHPAVRVVSFTGSTAIGKVLLQQGASTVKRVALELGGNAPFLVFDDADLDAAVDAAIAAKYRNAGQTCVCVNRFLVQDGIYERFAERLSAAVAKLKVGDGSDETVRIGPLINGKAIDKAQALLGDALGHGARVLTGGAAIDGHGSFFQPTVVADVPVTARMAQEEVFGPISALFRFRTEDEAITIANDTPYGLAAYVFSRDLRRVWRVMERLEVGMVGINEGLISTEVAPFGGVKQSGLGREGGHYGVEEYLDIKYVCVGGLA